MDNAFPGSSDLTTPSAAVNNPFSSLQCSPAAPNGGISSSNGVRSAVHSFHLTNAQLEQLAALQARVRASNVLTSSYPPATSGVELEASTAEAPKFHDPATSSEAVGGVHRSNNAIMYGLMSPSYGCRLHAVRTVISQIPKDLVTGNAFIKTLNSPATYENFDRILNDVAKFLASPLLVDDLEFLKEDPEKLCTISSALNMVGNLLRKERKGAKKYEELAEARRTISELRQEVADAEEFRKQATKLEVLIVQDLRGENEKLKDELEKKEKEIAELSRQLASAQMTLESGQKRENEVESAQRAMMVRARPSQATASNAQKLRNLDVSTDSQTFSKSPVSSSSPIPPSFVLQVPTAAAPNPGARLNPRNAIEKKIEELRRQLNAPMTSRNAFEVENELKREEQKLILFDFLKRV